MSLILLICSGSEWVGFTFGFIISYYI